MSIECEFCKHSFSSKTNLRSHQKKTLYCLEIQYKGKKNKLEIRNQLQFECLDCNKKFPQKQGLSSHSKICQVTKKIKNEAEKLNQPEEECNEMEQSPIDFDQNGNMFICKLKLPSGELIDIPIRSDGYMNATLMCKAHNKRFNNWNQLKETQAYLKALNFNTGIPVLKLVESKQGGDRTGTWVHRKVAIYLSQWLSPEFAVCVSGWMDELLITGKVELGKEKTPLELEEKLEDLLTNKIRFDLDPYTEKDVIYFYQVVPKLEYAVENKEERDLYEFGVTSDIVKRDIAYNNDKHYEKVKLKNVIVYGDRNKASRGEKRIKNIIVDLDIKAVIGKKKECFMATLDELDSIYKQAVEHSGKLNTKKLEDSNMEMEMEKYKIDKEMESSDNKYKIEMESIDNKYKIDKESSDNKTKLFVSMFEKGTLTFEQFERLIKY
jgi:hypothetical protein